MEGDGTPSDSSVAVDSMRTSLSLMVLTPRSTVPRSTRRSARSTTRLKPRTLSHQDHEELVASGSMVDTSSESRLRPSPWTTDEVRALVSFLLLYSEGSSWTSRAGKTDCFWEKAGQYVQSQVNSSYCRSGTCMYTMCWATKVRIGTCMNCTMYVYTMYIVVFTCICRCSL